MWFQHQTHFTVKSKARIETSFHFNGFTSEMTSINKTVEMWIISAEATVFKITISGLLHIKRYLSVDKIFWKRKNFVFTTIGSIESGYGKKMLHLFMKLGIKWNQEKKKSFSEEKNHQIFFWEWTIDKFYSWSHLHLPSRVVLCGSWKKTFGKRPTRHFMSFFLHPSLTRLCKI